MAFNLQLEKAHLTVIWCDRCGRAVNLNDEKDHFHDEQCGACRMYKNWTWTGDSARITNRFIAAG
jgi:hypothetical protein